MIAAANSLFTPPLAWWKRLSASDYLRKVAQTYTTQVIVVGLQMAATVVAARALGPMGRGLYAVAVAIGTLGVRLTTFGLHASNTYYVAKRPELLPSMTANTLVYSLLAGSLAALGLGGVFQVWPAMAPLHGTMLLLGLVWIPLGLAYLLSQNLLIGIGEIKLYNLIELVGKITVFLLVIAIVLSHSTSPETIFLVGLVVLAGSLLTIVVVLRRLCPGPLVCSWSMARKTIAVGFRAYLISFFGFLVLRLDLLMVQKMLGPYQSGNYSIASTMADAVYILPTVFAAMLFPKLCRISDARQRLLATSKAASALAALLIPLAVGASFFAVPMVRLIFGPAFSMAAPAFVWLMPGIVFLGVESVAVQFLNSFGFPSSVIVVWLVSTLLNVGLNLWAIPAYGINGAAAVSSITYITTSLFIFVVIARTSKSSVMPSLMPEEVES